MLGHEFMERMIMFCHAKRKLACFFTCTHPFCPGSVGPGPWTATGNVIVVAGRRMTRCELSEKRTQTQGICCIGVHLGRYGNLEWTPTTVRFRRECGETLPQPAWSGENVNYWYLHALQLNGDVGSDSAGTGNGEARDLSGSGLSSSLPC